MKSKTDILVIGYPKSGNTWLSRLLGDALDSPVTGIGTAKPLAEEGLNRPGPYTVRQLHLRPTSVYGDRRPQAAWGNTACNNAWWYGIELHDTKHQRPILIIRDPRDVAASVAHYWNRTIIQAVEAMVYGQHPLKQIGTWQDYIEDWMTVPFEIPIVKYERLHADTIGTLLKVLDDIKARPVRSIPEVVRRQSFATRREQLERDGDAHPYGKETQLHNLNRGIVGNWRNHFTPDLLAFANSFWYNHLALLGYTRGVGQAYRQNGV